MSIKITQPFSFDSRLPNFERDIIDSSQFLGQGPLNLSDADRTMLAAKYDVGHIVWDIATSKHYGVGTLPNGEYTLYEIKLTDTTLSGIAYCDSLANLVTKTAVMPGFDLAAGQRIILHLTTSSIVADATLNVNSTGAKTIKINGYNTTATNFKAGYWLCQYDGTNWNCERFLNLATASLEGVVKLGNDTVQTNPMENPTTVYSRTYPIQLNSDGQMVVNVPWKDVPREEHKLIYYTPDDPNGIAFDGLTAQQFMFEDGLVVDNADDLAACMQSWGEIDFTMGNVAQHYVTELLSCNPFKANNAGASNIISNASLEAGAVNSSSNEFWGYSGAEESITTKFNDDWGSRKAILYDPDNEDKYFMHDALYGFTGVNGQNDSVGLTFLTFGEEIFTDSDRTAVHYGENSTAVDESQYTKAVLFSIDLGCRSYNGGGSQSFTMSASQYRRKPNSVINNTTPSADYEEGYKANAYWRNGAPNRDSSDPASSSNPQNLPYHETYFAYNPAADATVTIVHGVTNNLLPKSENLLPRNGLDGKYGQNNVPVFIRCVVQRTNNIYKFNFSLPHQFTYHSGYKDDYIGTNPTGPAANACEILLNLDNYTISYKPYSSTLGHMADDYIVVPIDASKRPVFDEMKNNRVYYGFWQASTPNTGRVYNISYVRGSELSNLILDIQNDQVWQHVYQNSSNWQDNWQQLQTTPLAVMPGSHMNWNRITHKLWYSNGNQIYQIFPGLYDDIVSAQVQADWDASDSDDPTYIWNKPDLADVALTGDYNDLINTPTIPTVPNHRTVNHEDIVEGAYSGDMNIHDGYYFPNAVQDADENWYGAVVIGDQVWLDENLRSTKYHDGVELEENNMDDAGQAYYYPMNNHLDGCYYNWYGAMRGNPSSVLVPSGIQGIAPDGFHVPSKEEFDKLITYVKRQKRYMNGSDDSCAKALTGTAWPPPSSTPALPTWPSVGSDKNNKTGFGSKPRGYYLGQTLGDTDKVFYWTTSKDDNGEISVFRIEAEGPDAVVSSTLVRESLCAVRCVSDLTPVQFRNWYVATYGTMQHHLANVQVQSNWNETNTSSPSYIMNKPTIPAAQIQADWNQTNTSALDYIKNKPTISAALYEEIHYYDLVDLIAHDSLVKGKMYRIIDYETTTVQTDTASAGHDFDVVVTAVSENQLDPRASAIRRKNDTYFYTAKSDLGRWLLLYDINNDTTKYMWADENNGKGVIYRMIDEFGNDCPYDFKNILFTKSNLYTSAYTFNYIDDGNNTDQSLVGHSCYGNIMKQYVGYGKMVLNFNVFLNNSTASHRYFNFLDSGCNNNTFGYRTNKIVFGKNCGENRVANSCNSIYFGDECGYNTIGEGCGTVRFGYDCSRNTLLVHCRNVDFGLSCCDNIINTNYCNNIRFENRNSFVRISNNETASDANWLQNIYIVQGFNNTSGPNYVDINTITRNRSYRTTVGLQTDGTVKIYNEEDPVTASSINSPLHIGPYNYDGSQEVTIGLYDGDDSDDYSVD